MTPAEIKDAVWSVRLLVEGRVIMLGDAVALAVCKALIEQTEVLRSITENPFAEPEEKAARCRALGLPPVPWRSYAEPGTMGTPEGEVHARAQADARLTCPTGVLVQKPLEPGGEVIYLPATPFPSSPLQAICTCGALPNRLPHQRDENCQLFTDGIKVT